MLKPILIDSEAFARERGQLAFEVAWSDLDARIASEYVASQDAVFSCRISGGVDGWQRPYLDVRVSGRVDLRCQRCLSAMPHELDESARLVLFADEASLDEAMNADEELEGLVADTELAVLPLIEDQILIAIPFSPLHENCHNPDLARINQNRSDNPFAALLALKNGKEQN